MAIKRFLAKRNQDGSYSLAIRANDLVDCAWVDFYDDRTGEGYQRKETLRERRGREIEEYFARCRLEGVVPRLFEMTGSARTGSAESDVSVKFDPLDENAELGFLEVESEADRWMCMIDGGTRLLGIERAVNSNTIDGGTSFDVRLFAELTVPEEIAMFLLINEKQKRVRTDLGVRVVQRRLDDDELTDGELRTLQTVVPETDKWRYDASRVSGRLNGDSDSSWNGLIQMPGDSVTKPIKLQAFWTSLKHLLDNADIRARLEQMQAAGALPTPEPTAFLLLILKNFWGAVADVNPASHEEPRTNVLWGSIGVNACHQALAEIVLTILADDKPDFRRERFIDMLSESQVADYDYWFSRAGSLRDEYPTEKGEATTMTGGAGYSRLATVLAKDWRAALHAVGASKVVMV